MIQKLLWLSLAGASGTLCRFALCEAVTKFKFAHSSLGTLAVNILGSFLFGVVYALGQKKLGLSPEVRVIILTGFMGAFTTFSTFAFDSARMMKSGQWAPAAANIIAQVTLGILALGIGVMAGRALE